MSTVVYDYFGGLYINLTNRCPNRCEFCIRNFTDSLGSADSLFLDHEPTVAEVIKELEDFGLSKYEEVVFCGYGEPTERLDELLEIASYIKDNYDIPVRINTNGLADLIWNKETAPMLEGIIDAVSISLNEADADKYYNLCHPKFGIGSYDAILKYIDDVKKCVPSVAASVVSGSLSAESVEICRKIAEDKDIVFKVR